MLNYAIVKHVNYYFIKGSGFLTGLSIIFYSIVGLKNDIYYPPINSILK